MPCSVPPQSTRRARAKAPALVPVLLAALLSACAGRTPERPNAEGLTAHERALAAREFDLPQSEGIEWESEGPQSVGALLAEIDQRARTWNQLKLTAQTSADRQRLAALEREAVELARKRVGDLAVEVQTGPPRNRAIAAMGLGFSRSPDALGPLLSALLDSDTNVVENALVGIGFLGSAQTPLVPLANLLETSPSERLRNNAAYAMQRAVAAGARDPLALPALRGALVDSEPGVRAAAALTLSLLNDGESVDAFGGMLSDPVPFVALAGASALSRIGQGVPEVRARAARYLAEAYGRASGQRRLSLQRELIVLSGMNLGDDPQAWRDWALRVQ